MGLPQVLLPEESPEMESAVVFIASGEVSPKHGWPRDAQAPSWDCRPADLPRHWRINSRLQFQVLSPEGQPLERRVGRGSELVEVKGELSRCIRMESWANHGKTLAGFQTKTRQLFHVRSIEF